MSKDGAYVSVRRAIKCRRHECQRQVRIKAVDEGDLEKHTPPPTNIF